MALVPPPHYRLAATRCCATCNEGYNNVDGSRHCSWHIGITVAREYVCDDYTPDEHREEIQRAPNLISISTCDLVNEIATREGVTEYVAGPQDRYLVRTKADDGASRVEFDLGPAVILVVVD